MFKAREPEQTPCARAQITEFLDTGTLAALEAVGGLRKPGEAAPAVKPTADAAMALKFV